MKINLRSRKAAVGIIVALVALLAVTYGVASKGKLQAYAVIQGKQTIMTVQDVTKVQAEIERLAKSEAERIGHKVELTDIITYQPTLVAENEITSDADIAETVKKKVNFTTSATAISVDGKKVVTVADDRTANAVLDKIKSQWTMCSEGEKIKKASFTEPVKVVACSALSRNVLTPEEALILLQTGSKTPEKYVVKEGDSLWLIARKHDLHVVDIKADNNLTSDKLKPGQELILCTTKPLVDFVAEIEGVKQEEIPYQTKVVIDESLGSRTKEKQAGKKGSKEVHYVITKVNGSVTETKVLAEKIISKPVDQIIARGRTKHVTVASRGSIRSSGILNWPLFGAITQRYRGGHTGIDIDGGTGEIIKAVAGGTVTFAGRTGGYGLMVTIDHGNGLSTRYAHCSTVLVSKGQKVERGEPIAKVGSSGRSTGSHLHFEVISNGSFKNPMSYLK